MICERYRARTGHYPEAVLADKLLRNRENLRYCAGHGIRLSGPRLGRPAKILNPEFLKQQLADNSARNAIEGKFGQCKRRFGLGRVMARRRDCSETVIAMTFLAANLIRCLWNTESFLLFRSGLYFSWSGNRSLCRFFKMQHEPFRFSRPQVVLLPPLTNLLMEGVLRFSFSNLSFLWTFVWLGCEFSCFRLAYAYNWIVHFLMC